MLETSKDVLNLVLALSIAAFTFFLCWALFLLVKMLRTGNEAIQKIKEKAEAISDSIETFKEKITSSAGSLNIIAQTIARVIGFVKTKQEKKKGNKKNEEE